MDGIKCNVAINKRKGGDFVLMIVSNKDLILDCDGDTNEYRYYCEELVLSELKTTLDSLKYDRFTSKFTNKPIVDWSFLASDSIKLEYAECCVCFGTTIEKLDCGHIICIPCCDKLKTTDGDTPCPICRQNCFYSCKCVSC